MSDIKLHQQDNEPEGILPLVKQLRIRDLTSAIKQIPLGDFRHLTNVAKGRQLNFDTFTLLLQEAIKTRTGRTVTVTIAIAVGIIVQVYPKVAATTFLKSLGFASTKPASGSVTAAQSNSGVGEVLSTLQSATMSGYDFPTVAGVVQGVTAACVMFAAYKLWNMRKRKTT